MSNKWHSLPMTTTVVVVYCNRADVDDRFRLDNTAAVVVSVYHYLGLAADLFITNFFWVHLHPSHKN